MGGGGWGLRFARQASFTVMQASHVEAAARLALLRDDADVRGVDGLCQVRRGAAVLQ